MATKKYNSKSPGLRSRITLDHSELSNGLSRNKRLTLRLKKNSGRNNSGKITIRRKGGGNKKLYRFVDFKRNKFNWASKK